MATNFQTELARLIRERLITSEIVDTEGGNSIELTEVAWNLSEHICAFFQVPDIVRESLSFKDVMIQYIVTKAIMLH
jgi:hypothetical protein